MAYIKKDKLSDKQVCELIMATAERFDVRRPTREELKSLFKSHIPIPLILCNEEVQVWADKYYIAYSYKHEPKVHYLYMSVHHMAEERKSRRNPIISDSYDRALEQIRETGKHYALFLDEKPCI